MKRALTVLALVATLLGVTGSIALAASRGDPGAVQYQQNPAWQDALAHQKFGGVLVSNDGQIVWQVVPGGRGSNVLLRYMPGTMASYPMPAPGSIWVGNPFTLQTYQHSRPRHDWYIFNTNLPTILTVNYKLSDLGGRSESTLRVVMFSTVKGPEWVNLPSTVDTVHHTVTAAISASGDYGLQADNVSPAPAH
jgi:hypothetical protein